MRFPLLLYIISLFFIQCTHPESHSYKRNKGYSSPPQFRKEEQEQSNIVQHQSEETIEPDLTESLTQQPNYDNVVDMENEHGVRYVWIEINGIKLKFIFDTGASSICISSAEAAVMFRQGLLVEEDIIGIQSFQDATGKVSEGLKINLREVKIGNKLLYNIEAIVIDNYDAPLLLGQSVFEKFGKIEIDNLNNQIIFR